MSLLNSVILLVVLIIFIICAGCIMRYRKPISETFKEKFGNSGTETKEKGGGYYTLLENQFKQYKDEYGIGMAPGVLRLNKDTTGGNCKVEGAPNELIQSNVAFEPVRMEYTNGDPECTSVERVWPGQLY